MREFTSERLNLDDDAGGKRGRDARPGDFLAWSRNLWTRKRRAFQEGPFLTDNNTVSPD